MSNPISRIRRALAALVLFSANALAICQPVAHYIYVGTGAQCDTASIQTAIDNVVCPSTTVVVSTSNGETYTGQHIAIANKSLAISGSAGICDPGPVVCDSTDGCGGGPPARIAIGGNGVDPVFSVSGNGYVTLANLDISGGKGADNSLIGGGGVGFYASGGALTLNNLRVHGNASGNGGGAGIYGDGTLTISGSSIDSNHASNGGGISAFSSYIGHVELILADNAAIATQVASNQADNYGGGIYASGNVHLQAVAAAPNRISIHANTAGDPTNHILGSGGGIYYSGTAFADIALPGGSIDANHADFGAGIQVGASSSGNAVLRVFSTDAAHPTMLFGNVATYSGGGLLVGGAGTTTHATACLFDTAIGSNTASQSGTAIYIGDGGRLFANPQSNPECDYSAMAVLSAVHCDSTSLNCNRIVINQSTSSNSSETPGVIDFTGAAQISARRVHIESNTASYAIRGRYATGASVAFSECVVDYNSVSNELVNVQGAPVSFDGCTFADDYISSSTVFAWDTGLSLTRSIVHESKQVLDPSLSGATVDYAIFNDPKLPTNPSVQYIDPKFADPANGDYHLQASSPAIDYAPINAESGNTDFDNRPREADLPAITNLYGARDLGAFEYPLPDRIFRTGFE